MEVHLKLFPYSSGWEERYSCFFCKVSGKSNRFIRKVFFVCLSVGNTRHIETILTLHCIQFISYIFLVLKSLKFTS